MCGRCDPIESVSYLGIPVGGLANAVDHHFLIDQVYVHQILQSCRYQSLSLIGRILLLKNLVASRFVYKFQLLPSPSKGVLQHMNKMYHEYVWEGCHHRLSKNVLQQPIQRGGLNMLNVEFQNLSLKWKWLNILLNPPSIKPFWIVHIEDCILIDVHDFLRCNIPVNSIHKLVRNYQVFPQFWKGIFQEWFPRRYVPKNKFWYGVNKNSGVLFNSAVQPGWRMDLELYTWLKDRGVFTWSELSQIWLFLSQEEQSLILNYYPTAVPVILLHLQGQDQDTVDTSFKTVIREDSTTKLIYSGLIEDHYTPPTKVWECWQEDLGVDDIGESWLNLCNKTRLIWNTMLHAFHIQFLHRAYCLNNQVSKFLDISDLCSFCNSAQEMYAHLFWECPLSQTVWSKVIEFCNEYVCVGGNILDKETCLLSDLKQSLLVFIATKVKYYFFLCRRNQVKPRYQELFHQLKSVCDNHFLKCKYSKNPQMYDRE